MLAIRLVKISMVASTALFALLVAAAHGRHIREPAGRRSR
jgi:hypothetical protein